MRSRADRARAVSRVWSAVAGAPGRLRRSPEFQLFGVMWAAAPVLTAFWWTLVALRALLPPGFAVAVGLLAGAIGGDTSLVFPLVAVGVTFVLLQTLNPLHSELGATIGYAVGEHLHSRLMAAASRPQGVAHLESAALVDEFTLARDFDLGITAPQLFMCMSYIGAGFVSFASGIVSGLVLFAFTWWAPLILVVVWVSPHVLLRESTMWRNWRSQEIKEQQRHADYAYRVAVDAPAAKELRLFGLRTWAVRSFASRRNKLLDLSLEAFRLQQRPLIWAVLLVLGGNLAVFFTLAYQAFSGELGLQSVVTFAGTALGVSTLAALDYDWWLRAAAQPAPVVASLEARMPQVGGLPSGAGSVASMPRHEIRFRGVRFAYPNDERPVLDGFDITVPAGSSLAIVGRNGAGKTTLTKLLCRLYDPQSGAIEVDGENLRSLDLESWRGRIAAVFQDFVRYEWPLRDNVAPCGGSDDLVCQSLAEAGAGEQTDLDTVLSRSYEGGTDLSGGQWQRVALARVLHAVHNGAGLVILDEPTAQLDVRGETEVFERILAATRGITTILISHRFSTVRKADLICVVEGGRVVEQGSHTELMERGGGYRTMFDLQAARFIEDGDESIPL